jgi:transcriptional regulator EpsA
MLDEREISRIHAVLSECHELAGLTDFKTFIRKKVRLILPHRIAVCGLGEARTRRVLRLINIDFPTAYLQRIIRPDQIVLSSPLTDWLREPFPMLLVLNQFEDRSGPLWYSAAREHGITSLACHGIFDMSSTVFSYFVFGELDLRTSSTYTMRMNLIVPHLHVALARLLTMERLTRTIDLTDAHVLMPRQYHYEPPRPPQDSTRLDITERERQVLRWIAAGKSNWEIGRILRISEFTVKNHVQSLLKKLSVKSRTQAVTKAISCGLLAND